MIHWSLASKHAKGMSLRLGENRYFSPATASLVFWRRRGIFFGRGQ